MQINPTFSFVTGATGGDVIAFETAVDSVISLFESTFTNANVTLNIDFAYGEQYAGNSGPVIQFQPMSASPTGRFLLGSNEAWFTSYSYSELQAALPSQTNLYQTPAYATLPATSPFGSDTLWLTNANAKALGLGTAGSPVGYDGVIGIVSTEELQTAGYGADWTTNTPSSGAVFYMIGVIEHELSEVMGRTSIDGQSSIGGGPGFTLMDLFRYAAPN